MKKQRHEETKRGRREEKGSYFPLKFNKYPID
jgi:hypothetical protein